MSLSEPALMARPTMSSCGWGRNRDLKFRQPELVVTCLSSKVVGDTKEKITLYNSVHRQITND